MNHKLDIIGIGAINFDFIFPISPLVDIEFKIGEETFVSEIEFNKFYDTVCSASKQVYHQIGGSALLALSALHNCDDSLSCGLVGIYGTPDKKSVNAGFPSFFEFVSSLSDTINDTSWLLSSAESNGSAIVALSDNQRAFIKIYPGANTVLKEVIMMNETNLLRFIEYLKETRCVHLTSFGDNTQFDFFIDCISRAKKTNSELIVSIDPGYENTHSRWDSFRKSFSVLDYLFLNESEYKNLCLHLNGSETKLLRYIRENGAAKIIVKKRAGALFIDVNNGTKVLYSHSTIDNSEIICDTGAGDAFAGGFLAGVLNGMDRSECVRLGGYSAIKVLRKVPLIIKRVNI